MSFFVFKTQLATWVLSVLAGIDRGFKSTRQLLKNTLMQATWVVSEPTIPTPRQPAELAELGLVSFPVR